MILGSAKLAAPSAAAARVLAQIRAEHRALLQAIGAMQALVAAAVEELAELAWWHVQPEEQQLLPIAQAILPEAAWREIAAAFADCESATEKGPVPA